MLREALDREKEISDDYRARLDRAEGLIADQRPAAKVPECCVEWV